MTASVIPLTALSEAQRTQALERFAVIRPALEDGVSQAQVARTRKLAPSTVQQWITRYREKGLCGLANHVARSDKGKSRRLPAEAIQLIEGLALQTPPRSAASIHRQVSTIAREQGWPAPSYYRVYTTIKQLDPALVTLAHQGTAAYCDEFDLLYLREAPHANAIWQADHTPLDVWLLDEAGNPAKPNLTAIERGRLQQAHRRISAQLPASHSADHRVNPSPGHLAQRRSPLVSLWHPQRLLHRPRL